MEGVRCELSCEDPFGFPVDILIDQGKDDEFLSNRQLLPGNFIAACTEKKIPVVFRLQEASIRKA